MAGSHLAGRFAIGSAIERAGNGLTANLVDRTTSRKAIPDEMDFSLPARILHREVYRSQGKLTICFGYDAMLSKAWQYATTRLA